MIPLPPAELTVVKTSNADQGAFELQIESALSDQLANAGLRPGATVLIKPSALLLNRAHRDRHLLLLRSLIKMAQAYGAKVSIGDSPDAMLIPTKDYWIASGLDDLADQTDCELFNFEAAKCKAVMVESRVYYLPEALNEFELIINAACLGIGYNRVLSGVIQNCLGFLPGRQLEAWDKSVTAVDLYAVIAPHLHLLLIEIPGESYLVFGEDGIAIDTTVFSRVTGSNRPRCLSLAIEAGMGIGYDEMITIGGAVLPERIESHLSSFFSRRETPSFLERLSPINVLRKERMVAAERCDGCSRCCDVCPTGSIGMAENRLPFWNMSLCIECWRCREHCPSNAIAILSSAP